MAAEDEYECIDCKKRLPSHKFQWNGKYQRPYCYECWGLRRILKTFDLTVEEYCQMEKDQNGCCAICGKPETRTRFGRNGRPLRLCVDHNAETGQVRGLLCSNCNVGIGLLDHNPVLLSAATDYLFKYESEILEEQHVAL